MLASKQVWAVRIAIVLVSGGCAGTGAGGGDSPESGDRGGLVAVGGGGAPRDEVEALPPVCVAGTVACEGTTNRTICKADGSGWKGWLPCSPGYTCEPEAGACTPVVCEPELPTCAGVAAVVSCNDRGTGHVGDPESCPEGWRCAGAAGCLEPECYPGEEVCLDGRFAICVDYRWKDDGCPFLANDCSVCAGTDTVRTCGKVADLLPPAIEVCEYGSSCGNGACVDWQCVPGTVKCGPQGELLGCPALGQGFEATGEEDCEGTCVHCLGSGSVLVCGPGGATDGPTLCDEGEACVPGAGCRPVVCEPGELRCTADSGLESCDPTGADFSPASPGCDEPPCRYCDGDGLEVECAPGGAGDAPAVTGCGDGTTCVPGFGCVEEVCEPGEVSCENGVFLACDESGLGAVPFTCGGYGGCEDGAGGPACDCPGCDVLDGCIPLPSGAPPAAVPLRVSFSVGVAADGVTSVLQVARPSDPYTGLPVADWPDEGAAGLVLREDGMERPLDCSPVHRFEHGTTDLVLVVDVTSSMTTPLLGLSASLLEIVVPALAAGVDLRVGAVAFTDDASAFAPLAVGTEPADVEDALLDWALLSPQFGGDAPENGLDAVAAALAPEATRPDALVDIVVVSDSAFHDVHDGTGVAKTPLPELLAEAATRAVVHALGPQGSSSGFAANLYPQPALLACATGGASLDLAAVATGDPEALLPLAESLATSRVCTFDSSDPESPHTYEVEVSAQAPGYVLDGAATRSSVTLDVTAP